MYILVPVSYYSGLAQLVERLTVNQDVVSSSLTAGVWISNNIFLIQISAMELLLLDHCDAPLMIKSKLLLRYAAQHILILELCQSG